MQNENTPPKESDTTNQETEVALDGATCSRSVLHPMESDHREPPTHYVVERRRADLGGDWKQVGNQYSTLERAEKEAIRERSSRKGMQSRIIPVPATCPQVPDYPVVIMTSGGKSEYRSHPDHACSTITPPDVEEMEGILERAYQAYRRHNRGIRGQTLTAADRIEYWAVLETLKWISSENDERMHHYQRRRASIVGLGLKLRKVT